MTESEFIADALDLSKWDENKGYGSPSGPLCAHCAAAIPKGRAGPHGIIECDACHKRSFWRLVNGVWHTWQKRPSSVKPAAGKRTRVGLLAFAGRRFEPRRGDGL